MRKREEEAARNITQSEISYNFSNVAFQVFGKIINSTTGKSDCSINH